MTLLLKEAFRIAVEVHGEQVDRGGEPYLFHVMRVAAAMENDTERTVAILHDVIEDDPCKHGWLYWTVQIEVLYGKSVRDAVVALTRSKEEPYGHYIRRLSTNPLAVKVKLQDLLDNMQRDRLRKLSREVADRLFDRYTEAYSFLVGKQWQNEDAMGAIYLHRDGIIGLTERGDRVELCIPTKFNGPHVLTDKDGNTANCCGSPSGCEWCAKDMGLARSFDWGGKEFYWGIDRTANPMTPAPPKPSAKELGMKDQIRHLERKMRKRR